MKSKKEIENGLAHCTGTEGYKYNAMFGKDFVYTDGFEYLMLAADAVWLMQAIFSYRRKEDFQLWTLKVSNGTAVLTMKEDTNSPVLVEQEIKYTDFPLDEINFYAINDHCSPSGDHVVLMLRTEY
jgi:hypothetical protein